jgi:hypothetical protein
MKFRITFRRVSSSEVSEIVDAFAGIGKVTISAETDKDDYNTGTYKVVTTWSENLYAGADATRNLHGFITAKRDHLHGVGS